MERLVIGILAPVDAGKTSLSEALLYRGGLLRSPGRVDHRDSYLDTERLERERGITIFSKQAVFSLGEKTITLLDTPGHADFSAEMERALSVLDYAILLISGTDGVQGYTKTLFRLLESRGIPCFFS
ncbi:MAG: GTP-binding protein [Oribacterium sp.]